MPSSSPSSSPSDEDEIRQVLAGKPEHFAELVKRYQGVLQRIGLRFFHDEEEAKDFTQGVLVRAYVALPSFLGKSRFSTWLFRIARNHGINIQKMRKPIALENVEGIVEESLDIVEIGFREDIARAVKEALTRLPEKQARCIELSFFDGLHYEEISAITGIPINTVKSHVHRAKRSLRKSLAKIRENM